MPAQRPEDIHRLWMEAYNAGDLASLSALYEPEARLVPRPGHEAVVGIEAIRKVLQGFLDQKGGLQIDIETISVIQAGDIALLRSRWRLSGPGRDAKSVEITHNSSEIARHQPDGSWLYLIDHPFGSD
jgi:uncharacterized protein (TIGR02246 family)